MVGPPYLGVLVQSCPDIFICSFDFYWCYGIEPRVIKYRLAQNNQTEGIQFLYVIRIRLSCIKYMLVGLELVAFLNSHID